MKNLSLILLCIILFASCKKGDLPTDNGCITQIRRHYIAGADSLAAANLLKQNNIPNANLAYERVILNDTIKSAGGNNIYQHIFAIQYIGGLPVLSDDIGFHFLNGVYQSTSGTRYTGVPVQNTHPILSLSKVRALFMDQEKKNHSFGANYQDSCLVAEYGYYNLNAGTGNNNINLVKAWKVTPNRYLYPEGQFRDDINGTYISYFDGIYTFEKTKERQSPSLN